MKMNLKTLREELRALSEKYPNSDLWTRVFFLLDEYEAELRQFISKEATSCCLLTERNLGTECPLRKEILGEEASE